MLMNRFDLLYGASVMRPDVVVRITGGPEA